MNCLLAPQVLASSAPPTVRDALKLKPTQQQVDYDIPTDEEIDKCKVVSAADVGKKGWIVVDADNRTLRAFIDNNEDRQIDQWSYYKDGIEVFRDVDSDFDGKADQYRWLGTAGLRWAEDDNEDGRIDRWRSISPEEVSAEIIASMQTADSSRFELVLITEDEIKALGVSESQAEDIRKRVAQARADFSSVARNNTVIGKDAKWVHFGGLRPGIIPAGTEGSTKDVIIYDSVSAVVDDGGGHKQISLGTLIRVGEAWRIVDLPEAIIDGQAIKNGGLFFQASHTSVLPDVVEPRGAQPNSVDQALFEEYEKLENEISSATTVNLPALNEKRADLLERIINAAENETDRSNWVRQYADMVSGAYQNDEYRGGLNRLQRFLETLIQGKKTAPADIAYATYRMINSDFSKQLARASQDDLEKTQSQYMKSLEAFVTRYPQAEHAPDAMLQLALASEFSNELAAANNWYARIARDFPESPLARKAGGAVRRINSEGKSLDFRGKRMDGQDFSLAAMRGRAVLIHYWADWCDPCKEDFVELKRMYDKYRDKGLVIIGVSVDDTKEKANAFLNQHRLPWTQLFESGGLESPLAEQLGIASLPTMLLVGKDGKVVSRNIAARELDRELDRILRDPREAKK